MSLWMWSGQNQYWIQILNKNRERNCVKSTFSKSSFGKSSVTHLFFFCVWNFVINPHTHTFSVTVIDTSTKHSPIPNLHFHECDHWFNCEPSSDWLSAKSTHGKHISTLWHCSLGLYSWHTCPCPHVPLRSVSQPGSRAQQPPHGRSLFRGRLPFF